MSNAERITARKDIYKSCREDYNSYVDSILQQIKKSDSTGNSKEVKRLVKLLSKQHNSTVMPSKNHAGEPIMSTEEKLKCWNEFLSKKFAAPASDASMNIEQTIGNDDFLTDKKLDDTLDGMKTEKLLGGIIYQLSCIRIVRLPELSFTGSSD